MKKVLYIITLLIAVNSNAQSKANFTKEDANLLSGSWKGSLTYLDYNSGKPYTMPANTNINMIKGTNSLLVEMVYPDEPKANSKDTLLINEDRTIFAEAKIVSRKSLADGYVQIITEVNGKDGNDNKNALLRKTYTFNKNSFTNRKDIKFQGTTEWIKRHEYSYTR